MQTVGIDHQTNKNFVDLCVAVGVHELLAGYDEGNLTGTVIGLSEGASN